MKPNGIVCRVARILREVKFPIFIIGVRHLKKRSMVLNLHQIAKFVKYSHKNLRLNCKNLPKSMRYGFVLVRVDIILGLN